jgi:hypothetical protein
VAAIFGVVAAVDGASGEMDDGVGAVKLVDPGAGVEAIPWECAPGRGMRVARENGDGVTIGVEMAGEEGADLSAAAGDEDAHGFKIRDMRCEM